MSAIQSAALAIAYNAACVQLEAGGRAELARFLKSAINDRRARPDTYQGISILVPDFYESVHEAVLVLAESLEQDAWDDFDR